MQRVLFVCTGNTCRSPMAEAILRNKNLDGIEARSAGVYASHGSAASPHSITVMNENKLLHDHLSRLLSKEDIDWATVILAMTGAHKQAIIGQYPHAGDKTFTLKEYAGDGGHPDVSDPFGGSADVYRATYAELDRLIEKAAARLMER